MAASATAEPEMPPIRKLSTMEICASPPASQPTRTRENSTSRPAMPEAVITLPATTKKGIAINGNDCVAPTIFCTATELGRYSPVRKVGAEASSSAKATGRPSASATQNSSTPSAITPVASAARRPRAMPPR